MIEENQIRLLSRLFNSICDSNQLLSIVVRISEKSNAKKYEDHGIISVTKSSLKVLLNSIHNRLYKKLEENIFNVQFSFRNGTYRLLQLFVKIWGKRGPRRRN